MGDKRSREGYGVRRRRRRKRKRRRRRRRRRRRMGEWGKEIHLFVLTVLRLFLSTKG